jgi:branched-chain amino acid transport system substrate-binding protein
VTHAGPWTFRVSPSDLAYGPALAQWSRARGVRRAAVLYANDEYGRGVAASFASAFRQGGGQVVGLDPYLTEMLAAGTGAEPYLRRALGRGMDALFIAGRAEDAAAIVPRVRALGYTGVVMGADGLLGIESEGSVGEGLFIGAAFFADAPDQAATRFAAEYRKRFKQEPNADAALGYDAMQVIARALAEAGTDRGRVRAYLEGIGTRHPPVEGVTGTIRFDRNGDVAQKEVAVGVVRGGTVVSAAR